ncbi:collagen alpha-1(X) chain-like [Mytilus edulis]|uniref:collagen alpha-1(X) chain-like n=1 Tax=Mytilus edulis TaxID=6550 RepID=UPI0039EFB304
MTSVAVFVTMLVVSISFVHGGGTCENQIFDKMIDKIVAMQNKDDKTGKDRPAFTVSLTTHEPTITGKVPIKFNNVILNRRGGYDPSTGYFTVPQTGLYHISATIMSRNGATFHASLDKNGQDIVLMYGTKINGGNESTNIVLELTKGDKVCVKHYVSGSEVIHGYGYCYFSGYYISK